MTKRAASLVIGLWLLAVVTSASAEGAWVLWDAVGPPFGTFGFRKTAAYESRAACLAAAKVRAERLLGKGLRTYVARDETLMVDSASGKKTYLAQCLPDTAEPGRVGTPSHPDTVDPRGPKGTK